MAGGVAKRWAVPTLRPPFKRIFCLEGHDLSRPFVPFAVVGRDESRPYVNHWLLVIKHILLNRPFKNICALTLNMNLLQNRRCDFFDGFMG